MTREEAIKLLTQYIDYDAETPDYYEMEKACKAALKVLKQEPCEDCISRAAAIQSMNKLYEQDCKDYGCEIPECFDSDRAIRELKSLPSVQSKETYNKGWEDGAKAAAYHYELCIEEIKTEIKDLHNSHMINFVSANGAVDTCLEIIDKHIAERGTE